MSDKHRTSPPSADENASTTPQGVDRREFLAVTAVGAAALAGVGATPAEAATQGPSPTQPTPLPSPPAEDDRPLGGKGHIVQVTHSKATEAIKKTDEAVVRQMVAEALKKFTGKADLAAALGTYFKKEDVVGIKVNTLGSPFASVHPATAFALAEGLHALGIPKKNIYIYDQYGSRMRKAGFKPLNAGQKEPEDDFRVHFHETLDYAKDSTATGGFFKHKKKDGYPTGSSRFPNLLGKLTAVINLCCVKDHDLTGVTGALKNVSYGNVDRVPVYHCLPECNPTCVHDGKCNVARVYTHPEMGGKVRLVVCDALRVLYQGGPQDNMTYKEAHNAILVSTDPVAIDRAILEIVNGYRKAKKLKPVEEDAGGRRAPRFIQAGAALGLGEADLAKIKWEKVELG